MTIAAIKAELESLPSKDLDQIAAYLSVLRLKRSGEFSSITNRLNDEAEGNWVSWEEAKKQLED